MTTSDISSGTQIAETGPPFGEALPEPAKPNMRTLTMNDSKNPDNQSANPPLSEIGNPPRGETSPGAGTSPLVGSAEGRDSTKVGSAEGRAAKKRSAKGENVVKGQPERAEVIGKCLERIVAELDKRDLGDIKTENLLALVLKFAAGLRDEDEVREETPDYPLTMADFITEVLAQNAASHPDARPSCVTECEP